MNPETDTAEALVRGLYRALLQREPDEGGLAAAAAAFRSMPSDPAAAIETVVGRLIASPEFTQVRGTPPLLTDHSQFGEFPMLIRRVVNLSARHRLVVDAGARGRRGSNSYDLLRHFGWRGILIEANPDLIAPIKAEFAGLRVDIVNCAVSDRDGECELFLGENLDISSLHREQTETWGKLHGSHTIQARRLPGILREREVPFDFDFLSLDLEGEDVAVLNDLVLNSQYRPDWVLIEASFNFQTRSLLDLALEPLVRETYHIDGQTEANLLLRRTR